MERRIDEDLGGIGVGLLLGRQIRVIGNEVFIPDTMGFRVNDRIWIQDVTPDRTIKVLTTMIGVEGQDMVGFVNFIRHSSTTEQGTPTWVTTLQLQKD